jgi:hypothetical protein
LASSVFIVRGRVAHAFEKRQRDQGLECGETESADRGDRGKIVAGLGSIGGLVVPESVAEIARDSFTGCRSIGTLAFADGTKLVAIGAVAFAGSTVRSIVLPSSVEDLGKGCFAKCSLLTSFQIDNAWALNRIEAKAFKNSWLATLSIPRELANLHGSALETLTSMSITRGASVFAFDGACIFDVPTMTLVRCFGEDADAAFCDLYNSLGPSCFVGSRTFRSILFGANCSVRQFAVKCSARSSIECLSVPATVEATGRRAFFGCARSLSRTFRTSSGSSPKCSSPPA